MRSSRLIVLVAVSLLCSCAIRKPEIPMIEHPAGPLLQSLERRARSFSTLRSVATLELVRKERRRSFENAGVLVKGRERFLIEAYDPLGRTAAAVAWNGRDVMVDWEGTLRVLPPGAGLERLLGTEVDPSDLADVLAGNVPGMARATGAKLLCAAGGQCLLELRTAKDTKVRVQMDAGRDTGRAAVRSCEVFRKDELVYRVRYDADQDIAGYALPTKIVVENPDKQAALTVRYTEPEVNVPLDNRDFELPGGEG